MKFRRPYESYSSAPTCVGETKKPVYTLVNRNGERSLKQVDEVDIPAYINSFEGETDLKSMLKRYSLTGDISSLNFKGGGIYADVSSCETNFARLLDATREIALLKLQASQNGEEVSKEGKNGEAAVTHAVSAAAQNVPNTESEVNHE